MRNEVNSLTCFYCKLPFCTSKRSDTKYCSENCSLTAKANRTDNSAKYLKHKDKIKARRKLYYLKVKDTIEYKIKAKAAYWKYSSKRIQEDVGYRLKKRLRTRLHSAIKTSAKCGSAVKDLGCSIVELKIYLESKFQPGMTWENWSKDGWHIDHIQPLSRFDLTDPVQFKQACHYTNLQPLWAKDHIKKTAGEASDHYR